MRLCKEAKKVGQLSLLPGRHQTETAPICSVLGCFLIMTGPNCRDLYCSTRLLLFTHSQVAKLGAVQIQLRP